jgi:AraC-like DNA-binding protein
MAAVAPDSSAFRFSTDDLPPADRLPFWREVIGRSIVKLDMEPRGDGPYRFDAVFRALPGLGVASIESSAVRVRRTVELIADDGSDDLVLSVPVRGTTLVSQLGRDSTVADGDATLMLNAEPGTVDIPAGARFLSLRIPFTALAPTIARFDPRRLSIIRGNSEAMRLLSRYVEMVERDFPLATPELRRVVVGHVHDLVALAVGATREAADIAAGRGVRAARLNAVKADIAENLEDERLSVAALAARHGISPRYVQRLFEGEGTTFTAYVLAGRLHRAHRMLADPRFVARSITSIAFDAGFGDLSYFDRAFRRRYGESPSDVRSEMHRRQA